MNQVKEGIFTDERLGKITAKPDQINYGRWLIPGKLGHAESEDLAARFVEAARQNGGWVGLSMKYIGSQLVEEIETAQKQEEACNAYTEEFWKHQSKMRMRKILSVLTLMIYPHFVPAPTPPAKPEEQELPFSTLGFLCRMQGVGKFHQELSHMIGEGWLEQETGGEGDNAFTVFFPTPELVSHIAS